MGIPIPTRLWWSRHENRCFAKHHGVEVEAHQVPTIPGLPQHLTEIDYFLHRGELRISAERKREMTPDECAAIDAFLERAATAARAAFGLEE